MLFRSMNVRMRMIRLMKGTHKQRIVGIIVVVAVAIILYPFLLSRDEYDSATLVIPEPPPAPEIPFYVEESTNSPLSEKALAEIAKIGDGSILATSSPLEEEVDPVTPSSAEIVNAEVSVTADNSSTSASTSSLPMVAEPKPTLGSDGLPISWSLQIAALSIKENANGMVDKLRAAGHQAYIRQTVAGNKMLYRIFIGPDLDRQKLEELRIPVDKQYGVKSLTVRFVP